ncbi:MAG TPA: protein phosphatase 2C domain-containing protein [Bryobacteraceae bacterium]|nr:protein phosphatase 2C domain-containing protein [Bryobacteraceae bacterium]
MLEAYGLSDLGCVRKNNEDYCLLAPELGLYIVADGMGGARAGEHASQLAAETVANYMWKAGSPDADNLVKAFEEANRVVKDAAAQDSGMEGMGTTLVAVLEAGEDLLIASVGDSRAYIYEGGHLLPVTEDQTWVNEVGRRLGIDEETLKNHPLRHVLTMAIGVSSPLRIHSYKIRRNPESSILLSSDGLHGVVPVETMESLLKSEQTFEGKCHSLIDAAKKAGGPDNITVVLLRAKQPEAAAA